MVSKEAIEENYKQEKESPKTELFARQSAVIENLIKLPSFNRIEAAKHTRELQYLRPLHQLNRPDGCRRAYDQC